jgi:hypothetical protein
MLLDLCHEAPLASPPRMRHECEGRSVPAAEELSMANDSRDSMIRRGKATVAVQRGAEISRFEVHTASLSLVPGRRRVRLGLKGGSGSVTLELSRIAFWRVTAEFHEQSITADDVSPKPRKRRRRS